MTWHNRLYSIRKKDIAAMPSLLWHYGHRSLVVAAEWKVSGCVSEFPQVLRWLISIGRGPKAGVAETFAWLVHRSSPGKVLYMYMYIM